MNSPEKASWIVPKKKKKIQKDAGFLFNIKLTHAGCILHSIPFPHTGRIRGAHVGRQGLVFRAGNKILSALTLSPLKPPISPKLQVLGLLESCKKKKQKTKTKNQNPIVDSGL